MNRVLQKSFGLIVALTTGFFLSGQTDEETVRNIYTASLKNGQSYQWLDHLSNEIGGRLSGSENAEKAVQYTKKELEKLGLDTVWLQPVMVPKWVRGDKETGHYLLPDGTKVPVNICALGGSVPTPNEGLRAEVIEVTDFSQLQQLGEDTIKGKIVFYNKPMQADVISTLEAYSSCASYRYAGAVEAVKYGAVGVITRSLSLRQDDLPHTGSMGYADLPNEQRIPSAAISTNDANALSEVLKNSEGVEFQFRQTCQQMDDVLSYNVIGEIIGSTYPDEYIVVGGHLDSWDLGDGSHDDGAGVVQSMDVLRLMKLSGIQPKRTIRVVLFMNEENGLRGGREYARVAKEKGENHVFALESDLGGFTPRGFSIQASEQDYQRILEWKSLFKPYLIHYFELGGSGADIGPLKNDTNVLAGLRPDSQRYFDHHHAANDTFDAVNKRELELGAATMTSLIYLVDKYGFDKASPIKD